MERDGILQLEKVFKLKNYKQAWAFSNKVSELAEEEFHHLFDLIGVGQSHRHLVEPFNQRPTQE